MTAGLAALHARPGFKLRRAHQAALSIFAEECGARDVTTTQYGVLVALGARPGMDQAALGAAVGLDRSTTALVAALLERRGLLRRGRDARDGRRRVLALTPAGRRLLAALAAPAERARIRLLAPLSPREAATLDRLLDKLLAGHAGAVRVKLRPLAPGGPDG